MKDERENILYEEDKEAFQYDGVIGIDGEQPTVLIHEFPPGCQQSGYNQASKITKKSARNIRVYTT